MSPKSANSAKEPTWDKSPYGEPIGIIVDVARESFLLRTDPRVLDALRRWAGDELRSVNGQIDYLLRQALKDAGRWKAGEQPQQEQKGDTDDESVQ